MSSCKSSCSIDPQDSAPPGAAHVPSADPSLSLVCPLMMSVSMLTKASYTAVMHLWSKG